MISLSNNLSPIVEPNDTISTAIDTGITSEESETFDGTGSIGDNNSIIDPSLDVDFFAVQLDAQTQITIDIDTPESSLDSVLRLFDASGNQLAFNDDFIDLDSFLSFTPSVSGTYYIGVSGFSNTSYDPFVEGSGFFGSIGDYEIKITVVPPSLINGTADDDLLTGTNNVDIIAGLAGDDRIFALGGNDRILGGFGDDLITAGDGDDLVDGESGDDVIFGNFGNDTLTGGNGLDLIQAGEGNDQVFGGNGKDRLFGESGSDTLYGEKNNDVIDGGDGEDLIYGGLGNDNLFGGLGSDFLYGEVGNDAINGSNGNDLIDGGQGNDLLMGGGFSVSFPDFFEVDTLTGGLGKDTFILGNANQVFYDDLNVLSTGEFDYAVITDFNPNQDVIQLYGSSEFYSLDFYTTQLGTVEAVLIYDSGVTARGEIIAQLQGVTTDLQVTSSSFVFL